METLNTAALLRKFPGALIRVPVLCPGNKVGIEIELGKGCAIANDHQLLSRTGHGHIHTADIAQETDAVIGVAARHADINNIALLALKTVDGIDSYSVLIRLQCRRAHELLLQGIDLLFVWR